MNEKTVKFWAFLAGLMLMTSIAVMIVDITIKTAILEESNSLKRAIWEQNGQVSKRPVDDRDNRDNSVNGSGAIDVLDSFTTGLETRSPANGTEKLPTKAAPKRTVPRTSNRTRKVPGGNQPMGTRNDGEKE